MSDGAGIMPKLEVYKCTSCPTTFELLEHKGELINMADDMEGPARCPSCGCAGFERTLQAGALGVDLGDVGGASKTYPYFDRSLGMEIQSAKHRKEVCRRRGLVPVDGDISDSRWSAEHRDEEAAWRRYKAQQERYEKDPQFADFRRLRDRGYFDDLKRRQR